MFFGRFISAGLAIKHRARGICKIIMPHMGEAKQADASGVEFVQVFDIAVERLRVLEAENEGDEALRAIALHILWRCRKRVSLRQPEHQLPDSIEFLEAFLPRRGIAFWRARLRPGRNGHDHGIKATRGEFLPRDLGFAIRAEIKR